MKTLVYVNEIQEIIKSHTVDVEDRATKKLGSFLAAESIQTLAHSRACCDEIKPGAVVKLASGGPMTMTVEDDSPNEGKVWVTWFAGDELKTHLISKAALVLVDSDNAKQEKTSRT